MAPANKCVSKKFACLAFALYGFFLGFQFKLLFHQLNDAGWKKAHAGMIQQVLPIGASLLRFIVPSKNSHWLRILLILTSILFISFKFLGEKKEMSSPVVFIALLALTNVMVAWVDTICRTYCARILTPRDAADAETCLSVALTLGPLLCSLVGWENFFVLVGLVSLSIIWFLGDLPLVPNDYVPEKEHDNRPDQKHQHKELLIFCYVYANFGILFLVCGSKVGEQMVDFSVKEILKQRGMSNFEILCFSLGSLVACKLYCYTQKEIKLSILVIVCTLTQIGRSVALLKGVGGWSLFCILFIQSASSGILTMIINKEQFAWMSRRESDTRVGSLIEISEKGTSTIIMAILPILSLNNENVLYLGIGAAVMFSFYASFGYPILVSNDEKAQGGNKKD